MCHDMSIIISLTVEYRVGQKECNTFQRLFISVGKIYENETLTTYKQRFDKLYGII